MIDEGKDLVVSLEAIIHQLKMLKYHTNYANFSPSGSLPVSASGSGSGSRGSLLRVVDQLDLPEYENCIFEKDTAF